MLSALGPVAQMKQNACTILDLLVATTKYSPVYKFWDITYTVVIAVFTSLIQKAFAIFVADEYIVSAVFCQLYLLQCELGTDCFDIPTQKILTKQS